MRGDADDWVGLAANSILTAIVTEAATKDQPGPFTLDDLLHAWLDHGATLVDMLPTPPRQPNATNSQARTYWFYEGCHLLEEHGRIAEVGEGKFVIASLGARVAEMRLTEVMQPDRSVRSTT